MFLPKIYVIQSTPVIGTLRKASPNIYCPQCGRAVSHYQELELTLDVWPSCDLLKSKDGVFFISESLLLQFKESGTTGYAAQEVSWAVSGDFWHNYSNPAAVVATIPSLYYFKIEGRCDGPWLHNTKGEQCPICRNPMPVPTKLDFDEIFSQVLGDTHQQPTLVFANTWNGEDVFYLSEPGPPVITEKVARILLSTGNLREEEIQEKDVAWRLMPEYARKLEMQKWKVPICTVLGPADWVVK